MNGYRERDDSYGLFKAFCLGLILGTVCLIGWVYHTTEVRQARQACYSNR